MFTGAGYSLAWICFSVPNIILAIAFGVAYWRLTSLNEQVDGIFCDAKLMGLHFAVFVLGAGLDFCLTSLQIAYKTQADKFSTAPDTPAKLRLSISIDAFESAQTIVWFFYQCVMLKVFVKYGRPVQEDTMQLFKQKLEQIYTLQQTPDRRSEKRQQAIDEIVEHRIETILRNMRGYAKKGHDS